MDRQLKSLCFATQYRNSGSLSNPGWIVNFQLSSIVGLKLKSATMPISFYSFDSRNNNIYFSYSSGSTLTATIPTGNYNSTTFPDVLQTALNAASSNFTVTYSSVTNKLTISNTTDFQFLDGNDTAYPEIGVISTDLNNLSLVLTPSNMLDLSGVKSVNLISSIDATEIVNRNYNLLASIPVSEQNIYVNNYLDTSNDYIALNIENLNHFSVSLYDENLRKLTPLTDFSFIINFIVV